MKVAIAGYGAEGESNYHYYSSRGDDVTIIDEQSTPSRPLPDGAKAVLGEGSFEQLAEYDLVVRTAGLNPHKLASSDNVWSATNEFFAQCPAPIIGVTGTKGKGTTCSLITSILRASGYKVHLVGNIGTPALSVLNEISPSDVVVYELSSFQLWDIQKSPHVAVVLMIEPDHLDVHADLDEYINAKANIARHQSSDDIVLYHPTNDSSARIAQASGGVRLRYAIADDNQVYVKGESFCVRDEVICDVSAVQLPGRHNLENACAAISAVLPFVTNLDYVEAGLREFTGLPHRLKFVREVNGVAYYDDSIATTPGSAIAALRSFDAGKVIILGGSDKGADYGEIIDECKNVNARVIAIGKTGERIEQLCHERGVEVTRVLGRMDEVVAAAQHHASSGEVVILSPASASFDQYKSYADRGEQFIMAVEAL